MSRGGRNACYEAQIEYYRKAIHVLDDLLVSVAGTSGGGGGGGGGVASENVCLSLAGVYALPLSRYWADGGATFVDPVTDARWNVIDIMPIQTPSPAKRLQDALELRIIELQTKMD